MNILVFEWGTYTHRDILFFFTKLCFGYDVVIRHHFNDINHDDEFKREFSEKIASGKYDFVYSTNYFPLVAECCYERGLKYISWSYDAPLNVPDIERTLGLPCNYAFMYDREQVKEYREKGFDNVYHLPLAVNTERISKIALSDMDIKKYSSQISFVGNLYRSEMLNIRSVLSDYYKGYLDSLMNVQSKVYGYYFLDEVLNDELIRGINTTIYDASMNFRSKQPLDAKNETRPVFEINKAALSYAMAAQSTREERLIILKLLSNHYDVRLYSREYNDILDKVIYMGEADYYTQMPKVFRLSKINLNITLKCIKSGIPLRALDIMGAGGFLISNYQAELAESFVDGEEMVMYDSIEDMYEKTKYYMENENIRLDIARKGCEKVNREYTYEDRIGFILETAGLK